MEYTNVEKYIKSLNSRGIVPGLSNEEKLLKKLGDPHHDLKFIHIAGTNGKGSVGAYLSSVLVESKNTVGRFVSPCVGDYCNTFLIDGKPIDTDTLLQSLATVKKAMDELSEENIYPTSFEAEVALAFVIFKNLSPDFVLLECGMGGKSDATNVIPPPELAVITKISADHTAYLGDTLQKIAAEKSGIIKSGTITVTVNQEKSAMDTIISKCSDESVPINIASIPTNIVYNKQETHFSIDNKKYKTKMLGAYQPINASLAVECAKILKIDENIIYDGIYKAQWGYRFERIGNFVLDGAHNPDGATALAQSIEQYFKDADVAFICGCFKDKDYRKIVEITADYPTAVYCIKPPTDRGLDPHILCDTFTEFGVNAQPVSTMEQAIRLAKRHQYTIIFGSLSILHEAKIIIEGTENNATL